MRTSESDNPEADRRPESSRREGQIKAFEAAWRQGLTPVIDSFLCAEEPARHVLLVELVHVDLEFRFKAGESVRVETYLERFPSLAGDRAALVGLIATEFEWRRRRKENPDQAEYRFRFPEHADEALRGHLPGDLTVVGGALPAALDRALPPTVPGYEIREELGRGGMGVVYRARDLSLQRDVALKFLPPEYVHDADRLQRFRREAQTASGLNHPHICTVHALGEHERRPFIVMEFIAGRTLRELAAERPSWEALVPLIGQAALALAVAHAAGVVHRDVKPENIMVRADGYVKVLDFGLARRLPTLAQPAVGRDTDPGALLGTVAYMSPEQTRSEPVLPPSDIFSLGIVLYQLVTGQHPFETDSALGMLYAIAARQPIPPARLNPAIPAALEGLISAMLHKDARRRPTAEVVAARLTELVSANRPRVREGIRQRLVVHREPELRSLRHALDRADAGRGTLVCVAGEPGIGKTTLVEDFLSGVTAERSCLMARGHCSERLANTEAYLPVSAALEDLLRCEGGDAVARLMKVVAPTWYALVAPADRESATLAATEPSQAVSRQAMLREFCNLLQDAARLNPVILFLDDVHWADVSTVDLLAYFGRHFQELRVLVIVTYRPTELLLGPHPFHGVKQELQTRGACTELSLGFLGRTDIDDYLALAFPGHAFPDDFAALIHARTEGSPLFMADTLRYLRDRGVLAEAGGRWTVVRELPDLRREMPESVRSMIQRKLEQLGEAERQLLSAASVQGHEFDSTVLAGALGHDAAEVEERLQVLEMVHGLVRLVREHEFPDRTLSLRYAFVHILYQQALYNGLQPTRRAALAVRLARVLEGHQGNEHAEAAAELACLYEVGRDFARGARQLWRAAQNAARFFAHREAVVLARRGLDLLGALPPTPARAALELPLQTTLGLQLQVTEGYAAPPAWQAYHRARTLCQQLSGSAPLFPVLWGLWLYHKVRSELSTAQEMADELLELARRQEDSALALQAHQALGITTFCRGHPVTARRHVEQATALYDADRHGTHSFMFGQDPGVICKAFGAVVLWLLGYPDAAVGLNEAAIQMSQALAPTNQAVALHFASMVHQLRRDRSRTRACAEAARAIGQEHGLHFWRAGGTVMLGWALASGDSAPEGLALLRQGLQEWRATGSVTYETYYLGLLAEVLGDQGQVEEARRVLAEALALVQRTGERLYEAELHRLCGALYLRTAEPERAESSFRAALDIAREQGARSLELRAVLSLVRHPCSTEETQRLLADSFGWFSEGFQTPDLIEARKFLENAS